MDEIDIRFKPNHHQFITRIDGHECMVKYIESENGKSWNMIHTWVTEELRGQGIATQARATDRKWTTSCSYAILFFHQHKEYIDFVKN